MAQRPRSFDFERYESNGYTAAATASVGCGRIDTCAKNRRRLTTTEAGMKVKETWELFVKEKLKGDYGTPDQTKITDDDVMCRTCFSNYERYAKAREVIDEAIKGFMKFECCKVAKCIGTIDSILTKFDSENNISVGHGSHARVSVSADAKMIAEHLIDYNAFVCEESCQQKRYSTFKNPKDLFSHDYEEDLLHFIKQNSIFR